MSELQAAIEFQVELSKFYNVDLFQRGWELNKSMTVKQLYWVYAPFNKVLVWQFALL